MDHRTLPLPPPLNLRKGGSACACEVRPRPAPAAFKDCRSRWSRLLLLVDSEVEKTNRFVFLGCLLLVLAAAAVDGEDEERRGTDNNRKRVRRTEILQVPNEILRLRIFLRCESRLCRFLSTVNGEAAPLRIALRQSVPSSFALVVAGVGKKRSSW